MRFLRALPALALLATATACGDGVLDLELQLVSYSCDQQVNYDPLLGVREIRVRAYHLPPAGEDRDFDDAFDYEVQTHVDSATASIPGIPAGKDRYLLVEGLDTTGKPISRGMAGPLDLSASVDSLKTNVFLRRVDAFTPVNTAQSPAECTRMRVPRYGHSSTLLGDGRVLIAGGYHFDGTNHVVQRSTEIFDPRTGAFSDGPSLGTGRAFHTATRIPGTTLTVIAGGERYFMGPPEDVALNTAEVYDESTGLFTQVPMQERRVRHVAAITPGGGKLLLIGGARLERLNDSTSQTVMLDSTEVFDPTRRVFDPGPKLNRGRADHAVTILENGTAVVAGGQDAGGFVTEVEVFRYEQGSWLSPAVAGNLTASRLRPLVGAVGSQVVVSGGVSALPNTGTLWNDQSQHLNATNAVDVVNLAEIPPTVGEGSGLNASRANGGIIPLLDGTSLIAGGGAAQGAGIVSVRVAEVLQPGPIPSSYPTTRKTRGDMRTGRYFASHVLLADGTVLITGGIDRANNGNAVFLSSAEVFQPDYRATQANPFR